MKYAVFALALSFATTAFAAEPAFPRSPRYIYQRTKHYPSATEQILLCWSGDFDVGISTSGAACIDPFTQQIYVLVAGGTGWSWGISMSVFTMYYVSYDKSPVEGLYHGPSVGGSLGKRGFTTGYFSRKAHLPPDSVFERRNSLTVAGITLGGNFDVSYAALTVKKVDREELKQKLVDLLSYVGKLQDNLFFFN